MLIRHCVDKGNIPINFLVQWVLLLIFGMCRQEKKAFSCHRQQEYKADWSPSKKIMTVRADI